MKAVRVVCITVSGRCHVFGVTHLFVEVHSGQAGGLQNTFSNLSRTTEGQ